MTTLVPVLGNFAMLAGIAPKQVADWYLVVYTDAYERVEHPNVLAMSQFADGGRLATKPYAASGAYIDRMSKHCKTCPFERETEDRGCPFNALYWTSSRATRTSSAAMRACSIPTQPGGA
jgi:deoxyribodipyrimidine photolyase-related protein